jgi:AcrR family transcriptional regulator
VQTPVVKPRRADAQRNRARLLAAAEAIFATKGVTASTEEIAQAAGVGIGTVFRHFPTKEALLEAVFVASLERLAARAEELATAPDPAAAFCDFFTEVVDQARSKTALAEALTDAGIDLEHTMVDVKTSLRSALEALLSRAQHTGAIRADIGVTELLALLLGASRAAQQMEGNRELQVRTVQVILDGLRAR